MSDKIKINGFNFISKTKLIIVFAVIIVIWSASYIIHLYETQDSFKVENIPYKQIDTIKIFDRGLLGNRSITIINRDSLNKMNKILLRSNMVNSDNINVRANHGECEIDIHIKNNKSITMSLVNTSFSGGILCSGDYCYQNTPLLNFVINKFRDNNQSNLN